MKKLIAIIFVITISTPCIFAKPKLPQLTASSGLTDFLTYAALNNPDLKSAFNRYKSALEQLPQAASLPDPQFNYKYYIEEVETRVGPQKQSFSLSQRFPWFGKLDLSKDIAAQKANAAYQRYENKKQNVFYQVKNAYFEYYYLAKTIEITEDNLTLIKHLESVSRNRYKTAAGSHPDVIRAQVELGKLDDRYQSLLDLQIPIAARLNAALSRPIDIEIPLPTKIENSSKLFNDKEIITKAIQQNPELKALDFEIVSGRRNIELARKDYYPDLTFGVSVIDTGDSPVGDPSGNGKDPVMASVSINLPFWREKQDAAVRQARYDYFAAQHQRKQRANSLSSELKLELYKHRDAQRKIELYRDGLIPKATESLSVTESSFRAGKGTFSDLIDAQRILLEFKLSLERSLTDKQIAIAKIEMLTGSLGEN